ncbi:MAG: hypothetical protein HRU20_20095 [Pseudomonadales bacterium]|nr:hypothetical protein [Pseudomonadales bacterium]
MAIEHMQIIPGIGIGAIRFGISETDLIDSLGKPDEIDELEHIEGNDDWYRELYYYDLNLSFSFEKEHDYKLGDISVNGKGHSLAGQDIFGFNIKWAKKFITDNFSYEIIYEDCTWNKPETSELLSIDKLGLSLWFTSGFLSEIICTYLFEDDNETIIWPKSS